MLNICIVFAQLERETIQMRVTDAYISRSRRGFYMGGRVPYGYRKEPYMLNGKQTSRYVVVPEEAEIVKLIYSLYAQPQTSFGDIVKYFMDQGIGVADPYHFIRERKEIAVSSDIRRRFLDTVKIRAECNVILSAQ